MNSSANLISLSDSGLTSSFSSSSAVGTTNHGGKDRSLLTDTPCNKNKSALLIDFTDEIQEPQAILTLAENDDTFGIFNKAPPSHPRVKEVIESDEASKPVRPFTLGRKSDRTKIDSCLETQEDNASADKQAAVNEKKNDSGDGGSTSESEQPTIVEGADDDDEECLSPITQGKDEEGITDQNMVATLSCNSGASDSDILDINNLSSFSIPEADYDDNEFLENIKKEVPASSAILDEIRYQIMQEQESNESKDQNLLSNMSRPSAMSRTSISSHNTVKFSSPPPRAPNSNRLSTVSTISSIQGDDDDTDAHFSRAKCRLSGILSSPIRASYPVSKYYMPTPKAMTPNPKGSVREKFSQSFCSPNMTRLVVTGNARRSPSRVPVRKSISAETLHYEFSPARNRNATQTLLKFSTPSAPSRARDFAGFQTTFINDRHMNVEENNKDNNMRSTFNKGDPFALEVDNFRVPRYGRLSSTSRASSSSTTSINTLSPTGSTSSMSRKDISDVVRQMKQMRLNDTSNSTSGKANRTTKAPASTALVQPMKATAIIPPSNASIIESRTNPVTNKPHGLTVTSSTEKRKFIPPIAASSPKTAPSPTRPVSQTTPSRTRYHSNVKSSGYGPGAQDLNASFGTKPPLQSPNPKTSSLTAMKPPAIPKSLGTRLQFAAKTELPRLGSKTVRTAMPPPKIPTISASATGLRRPASGTSTTNKENNTRTIGLKTGASTRPRQ